MFNFQGFILSYAYSMTILSSLGQAYARLFYTWPTATF